MDTSRQPQKSQRMLEHNEKPEKKREFLHFFF